MKQDALAYVVDDDDAARDAMRLLLMTVRQDSVGYASPTSFIEEFDPRRPACVILDMRMPELNGIETLIRLRERSKTVPVVFITGHGDLSTVVRAMKLGAVDFFEKPANSELMLECVQQWIRYDIEAHKALEQRLVTIARLASLSNRERQVLDCVLNGMSNKETARHLGVGPKAIEFYRAHLMQKMHASNVVRLVVQILGSFKFAEHADEDATQPPQVDHLNTLSVDDDGRRNLRTFQAGFRLNPAQTGK